jgi:hypothetical protein
MRLFFIPYSFSVSKRKRIICNCQSDEGVELPGQNEMKERIQESSEE